jgi:AraC-like DNA-binding protein
MINELRDIKEILCEQPHLNLVRADSSLPPTRGSNEGFSFSHTHRIALPLSGCHKMETARGGKLVRLEQTRGSVTFMPRGVWNRVDWYVPVRVATFIFESGETYVNMVSCPGDGRVNSHLKRLRLPPLDREGHFLMEMLLNRKEEDRTGQEMLVGLIIHLMIEKTPTLEGGKAHLTYRSLCSWLNENWASCPSRTEVAGIFKITPNYLSHLFRSQGRINFSDYLNTLRLNHARELLIGENMTLAEISRSCGFSDAAYFCRVFKKETGLTPLGYRLFKAGMSKKSD